MKYQLEKNIKIALISAIKQGNIPNINIPKVQVERTKNKVYGDFSSNIAMILAKQANINPLKLASIIVRAIPKINIIDKIDIAGQGFINFTLSVNSNLQIVRYILATRELFGKSNVGKGKRIQVEFVSANPTGPLHVGHGRSAVYGSIISNLSETIGFKVHREYYINDAGRQVDILAISVWLRYLDSCGENISFPSGAYRGRYIIDIANILHDNYGYEFVHSVLKIFTNISEDQSDGGDRDCHIDDLIEKAKQLLGHSGYLKIFDLCLNTILLDISNDLSDFGSNYDEWFSELSLIKSGAVDRTIEQLRCANVLYQKDGACWFKSTYFGDEKDRVVVRDNGQTTYFASDIAYHLNKFQRDFDEIINIWGSDHHGYIPRIQASLSALNQNKSKLKVLLVQFAVLYRGGDRIAMSTRSGEFVTLRTLREEIGKDAARFFYVMHSAEQHMDFDLELTKLKSKDNPVYYVQYAYARICRVFRRLADGDLIWNKFIGESNLSKLVESHERDLLIMLARYPEILEFAALKHMPHILAHFLMDLASSFHTYYNAHDFIIDNIELSQARLTLVVAVRQVIANGLTIMGISTPESM